MRALPFAKRLNWLNQLTMFRVSSRSAATSLHERQSLRAARKYCAARLGLRATGCEEWLPSFHTPIVLMNGWSFRRRLNAYLYFATLGALQTLRFEYLPLL